MENPFFIYSARVNWYSPYEKSQTKGSGFYILYHFKDSITLTTPEGTIKSKPHAFFITTPTFSHTFPAEKGFMHDFAVFHGDVLPALQKYDIEPNTFLYPKNPIKIQDYLSDIESFLYESDQQYLKEEKRFCMTELILIELSRQLHSNNIDIEKISISQNLLAEFHNLRAEFYNQVPKRISVKQMSQRLAINESLFHKYYKVIFNTTPNKDLIRARIEYAKTLLITGSSVVSVAETLGYPNQQHFIRQFKQITGLSPGKYALKNKNHYFRNIDAGMPIQEKASDNMKEDQI